MDTGRPATMGKHPQMRPHRRLVPPSAPVRCQLGPDHTHRPGVVGQHSGHDISAQLDGSDIGHPISVPR